MKRKKFDYIRTGLERLAESRERTTQMVVNRLNRDVPEYLILKDSEIQKYNEWLEGINLVYRAFCAQFNIPYQSIKTNLTNY